MHHFTPCITSPVCGDAVSFSSWPSVRPGRWPSPALSSRPAGSTVSYARRRKPENTAAQGWWSVSPIVHFPVAAYEISLLELSNMCGRSSLAIAAAMAIVVGVLCSEWCELNCAFFGCSLPDARLSAAYDAPLKHCHAHHERGPDPTPARDQHSTKCQHVVVATLPATGPQLGVAINSTVYPIADLALVRSAGFFGLLAVAARGAPFRSPPARAVTSSVLRI